MTKKIPAVLLFCLFISFAGCAQIVETTKVIWGSSTRALEEARVDAISKTYRCSFNNCYDAVLELARTEKPRKKVAEPVDGSVTDPVDEVKSQTFFNIFIDNRKKRHIVVMGVEGNVETTEVGIFFSQPSLTTVELEIASLSSSAKRKVAEILFNALDLRFSEPQ